MAHEQWVGIALAGSGPVRAPFVVIAALCLISWADEHGLANDQHESKKTRPAGRHRKIGGFRVEDDEVGRPVSQSVSYFTVPPRAHPSSCTNSLWRGWDVSARTGSQSGSATPGQPQVPSSEYSLPGATLLLIVASEVSLSQRKSEGGSGSPEVGSRLILPVHALYRTQRPLVRPLS